MGDLRPTQTLSAQPLDLRHRYGHARPTEAIPRCLCVPQPCLYLFLNQSPFELFGHPQKQSLAGLFLFFDTLQLIDRRWWLNELMFETSLQLFTRDQVRALHGFKIGNRFRLGLFHSFFAASSVTE